MPRRKEEPFYPRIGPWPNDEDGKLGPSAVGTARNFLNEWGMARLIEKIRHEALTVKPDEPRGAQPDDNPLTPRSEYEQAILSIATRRS